MKIAWLSNAPWAPTGYGNQTNVFVPRLQAAGHQMAVIAFYGNEGGMLNWNGIPIFPRAFHPYGQDVAAAHAASFGADILISLMDAWVCTPETLRAARWCPWFPVDMDPLPPPVRERVRQAFQPIVYSRFGERMCQTAGIETMYVPHGVDTQAFRPEPMREAREKLNWPQDTFVVGMVAANKGVPSRKAFPQQLEAFAQFRRRHSDAVLYLHTMRGERGEMGGVNLVELCEHLDLRVGTDVLFCDQYQNTMGFPDAYMSAAYSGMDVLLSVTMGEGFGIPIVEAQACGTPVIIGGWTAMPELLFSGWQVSQEEADKWWTPLGAYQWTPRVGAIAERLEAAYSLLAAHSPEMSGKARQGALAYDADRVVREYWLPVLKRIEERVAIAQRASETVRADWLARA
ncbi:MAG: glycosyltransferase family 4 protein [Chloroflexi bacterium]|nr:glycosyltransferase family 4 protein [Chloroflexota bacterium]